MPKKFYVSGFLYNSPSQQILLQQRTLSSSLGSPWSLFSRIYTKKNEPVEVFKNLIYELLRIKINSVQQVYSYFNENTGISQCIVYSELKKFKSFSPKNGLTFAWFSFKDVLKLHVSEQTKHDIVVGQRVIHAAERKSRGEHTFQ